MKATTHLALATATLMLCMSLPVSAATQKDAKKIEKAQKLLEKGRHKSAERLLEDVNDAAEGKHPEALAALTDLYLQIGRPRRAIPMAKALVELADTSKSRARAQHLLGSALYRNTLRDSTRLGLKGILIASASKSFRSSYLQTLEQAKEAFESAALEPGFDPWILYQLAEVLTNLGQIDEATQRLQDYFEKVDPTDAPNGPNGPNELQCFIQALHDSELLTSKLVQKSFTAPKVLDKKKLKYTKKAVAYGFHTNVFLGTVINKEGKATCIRVLQGGPLGLTEAALEALEGSTFEPLKIEDTPVSLGHTIQMSFGSW